MIREVDLKAYDLKKEDVLFIDFAFEQKEGERIGGIVRCRKDLLEKEGLAQDLFDAVLDVLVKHGYASKVGGDV